MKVSTLIRVIVLKKRAPFEFLVPWQKSDYTLGDNCSIKVCRNKHETVVIYFQMHNIISVLKAK